ncbi:MAG: FAD-dependent oxidoreductase [Clostridiales bacterium]|nr:FAD-dependent oxidoreductase [Clostridiales bacterium]
MIERNPNSFNYRSLESLKKGIKSLKVEIAVCDELKENLALFKEKLTVEGKTIPNRFCIQPMEGCDGESDGSPGELTYRRYKRFARGGSGMIWVEATAVTPEGRANPRQLWITEENKSKFRLLADMIRENAIDEKGNQINPFLVLQITHSGRYSKPQGKAAPMIFHHSPILDPTHKLSSDYPLLTDEYMDELKVKFINAAKLAYECGYDAVDIKCCHGYLLHELLSTFTRKDSKYAGKFENRIRFLTEVVSGIRKEVPNIIITSRLNVYDAYPYPYGWGMKTDGSNDPDISEPVELIRKLKELGVAMLNIAFGNPYFNPNIERPFDFPAQGGSIPEEHPLKSIEREINLTSEIALKFPDMTFVSVGFTWLREYFPYVCIPMLKEKKCDVIGLGRLALANPGYANELFGTGRLAPEKLCITCSSCTQIMRDGGKAGCVIRDTEVYGDIYYKGRLKNEVFMKSLAEKCRNCWGPGCMGGCPAGIDIPGFIKAFYDGDTKKAYEIIREKNTIPEACAYVCPVEEQCEKACTSGILSHDTVPIHEIQRFISQEARVKGWTRVTAGSPNGRRVAVIGFGPAGIAASTYLIEKGFKVTVFEATDRIGGTAAAVIPDERLQRSVLEDEVASFKLNETGLFDIKFNTEINKEYNLDNIFSEGFDAIFISVGQTENSGLPFKGKPDRVYSALEFLSKFKQDQIKLSSSDVAAVIGGGNTAMDAACSLKHAGVRDVYLIYRRSYRELPAWEAEVAKALKLGVHFIILNQPVGYMESDGKLTGIKLAHTQLGEPDNSGRPAPIILTDSEYVFPLTLAVEATGQKASGSLAEGLGGVLWNGGGRIKIVHGRHETARAGVYAGGDIINGGETVVQAVRDGLDAASEICIKFGIN